MQLHQFQIVKEIISSPPAIVENEFASVRDLFQRNVLPTYARFDLALSHGAGSYVFDVSGRRYLDLGGGIAVNCLGHAHPAITEALVEQSKKFVHVSNLYYSEPQGRARPKSSNASAPAKCFSPTAAWRPMKACSSSPGNLDMTKGVSKFSTATNSFHGRTLAGISATGQEKVKKGFEPMTPGFRHIPYNDLEAARAAISPATVAILIEGVQGEGGVTPASPSYLLGLRALCDEKKLLLFMDSVQCGHFRTGRYQSFQRTLESAPGGEKFLPDGVSMAKSLGGGFPMGAFWVRGPYADLLGPGAHGTTCGGSPLGCAVALKVFEVIEREKLDAQARKLGDWMLAELKRLAEVYPTVVRNARGLGFMLGLELVEKEKFPRLLRITIKPPRCSLRTGCTLPESWSFRQERRSFVCCRR